MIKTVTKNPAQVLRLYPHKGSLLPGSDADVLVLKEDLSIFRFCNTLEDMAFVKSLVVEAVKSSGYAVLNADDAMTDYVSSRLTCNLILFSQNRDNRMIERHINRDGIAVVAENGLICIYKHKRRVPVMGILEIPITRWIQR